MYSNASQNIKMSWINIYWVIHYFVEGVKMAIFTWDSDPNYKGVKMTSERLQHQNVIFTEIGKSVSKICWL